ncbi:MAG: dTMP kinase [Turneriella sp.]|nr:dTMP kinase [Turneriella sp.]
MLQNRNEVEYPGFFTVLEGIDGSGKSTTAREIATRLMAEGLPVVVLREPTGKTDASREIRRLLRQRGKLTAELHAHLLELFLIDRLWDIQHEILPALRRGKIVLLDRYYLSTAAYQAQTINEALSILESYLNDSRILQPELWIYLELPIDEAIKRLSGRNELEIFENSERLEIIRQHYAAVLAELDRKDKYKTMTFQKTLSAGDFDALAHKIANAYRQKNG